MLKKFILACVASIFFGNLGINIVDSQLFGAVLGSLIIITGWLAPYVLFIIDVYHEKTDSFEEEDANPSIEEEYNEVENLLEKIAEMIEQGTLWNECGTDYLHQLLFLVSKEESIIAELEEVAAAAMYLVEEKIQLGHDKSILLADFFRNYKICAEGNKDNIERLFELVPEWQFRPGDDWPSAQQSGRGVEVNGEMRKSDCSTTD